jgi:hypothetical protein
MRAGTPYCTGFAQGTANPAIPDREVDADSELIVGAWPNLPQEIRSALVTLAKAARL